MLKKILSIFFILTAALLITVTVSAAESALNLQGYLAQSLTKNEEVKKAEMNLEAKEIALAKEKAEQEVRPSPLLLEKAKTELEIAARNLEITKDQVTTNLINDFFNYYKAKNSIVIHQRYQKILEEELENIKEKYEQGILIKSDLMQAEVELKTAASNLKAAVNNKKRAEFKVKQNLKMELEDQLQLNFKEDILKNWQLEENLKELFQTALKKRIEVKEAEANKELQKINYRLAAKDYSSDLDEKEAKNELKNAENQLELIKDKIKLDVNDKYLDHQDSIAEIERYQKLIESFEEALRVKKLYFEEDYITGTELLETQVDLYQSEINYAHAQIDYYLSLAELYLSTGDFKEALNYENK
jgi:outer membrane protein TolC